MSLKNKFSIQNIKILLITAVITLTATLLYGSIYARISKNPLPYTQRDCIFISQESENIISNINLTQYELKSLLMDVNSGKSTIRIDSTAYTVSKFAFGEKDYIVQLTPIIDFSSYYIHIAIFTVIIFMITFGICSFVSAKGNIKSISEPIVRLKEKTDLLTNGNFDTPIPPDGIFEIRDLFNSVEQLRITLKESAYYRKKADDSRKFLLSGISHDLRSPITAARGYIEGILDNVADSKEKQDHYLNAALNKINTVNIMIDDLLLYSKLDLNFIPFEFERVNISEFIENYVNEIKTDFQKSEKELEFVSDIDYFLDIDKQQFKRVLQNILTNAEKHILPKTGKVRVLLRETKNSIIIEISDNGAGIPEKDLPYIFNRFYKGNAARTSDNSSGLGLTIAKQIVEGLNGRIWATSEIGKGTSIMISFFKERTENEKNTDN